MALAGQGSTFSPGVTRRLQSKGERTVTWSFATQICNGETGEPIVIDRVDYDTSRPLGVWEPGSTVPAVGTRLRTVPVGTLPMIADDNEPDRVAGNIATVEAGPAVPIDYGCDDYASPKRTWPVVELLTVITADKRGAVVESMTIEYHVGSRDYTLTIPWKMGHCGTLTPKKYC